MGVIGPVPTSRPSAPAKPARWQVAGVLTLVFVAALYVIEFVDQLDCSPSGACWLDDEGVRPLTEDGLWGILWAPMLHAGWDHLVANTLPVLVLGFLALLSGIGRGLVATAIIWIVAGVGTWFTGGANTVHVGASVLIFGWLTYVILRGFFIRNVTQILIGIAVFVYMGSALLGVLPGQPGISWQGHLFGAIGGVLAAWLVSGDSRKARAKTATPQGV